APVQRRREVLAIRGVVPGDRLPVLERGARQGDGGLFGHGSLLLGEDAPEMVEGCACREGEGKLGESLPGFSGSVPPPYRGGGGCSRSRDAGLHDTGPTVTYPHRSQTRAPGVLVPPAWRGT